MKRIIRAVSLAILPAALALGACDYEGRAEDDAADAGADVWAQVSTQSGALGADPSSGMMVPGDLTYSPDDPVLDRLGNLVVLGGPGANSGVRTAFGPSGAVLLGPSDLGPSEPGVIDAPVDPALFDPAAQRVVATGRWLVSAGRPIVVDGDDVDLAWAASEPSDIAHGPAAGHAFSARLPVVLERLPASARAMLDATVRVFDQDAEVCIARVTGFALEARLVHEPLGPWDPAYSDRELFARGLRALVADLEPLAGSGGHCDAGMVAVGVDAPSPRLFREVAASPGLARRALQAACKLAGYSASDDSFDDFEARPARCDLNALGQVRAFEARDGTSFAVVARGSFVAGFSVGLKNLAPAWSYTTPYTAVGLIDVQGDGSPELLMPELERAPRSIVGPTFGGDAREPTYAADWTPIAPLHRATGGHAVPDFSVFLARDPR